MTAPGPRQPTARPIAGLATVPRSIAEITSETTFDTVPNRFVKYVLTRWRNLAVDVAAGAWASVGRRQSWPTGGTDRRREACRSVVVPGPRRGGAVDDLSAFKPGAAGSGRLPRDLGGVPARRVGGGHRLGGPRPPVQRRSTRRCGPLRVLGVSRTGPNRGRPFQASPSTGGTCCGRQRMGLSLDLRNDWRAVVSATGVRRGGQVIVNVWFNRSFPRSFAPRPAKAGR